MASVNFYLDKVDKKGFAPIHLRINCNGTQIKISIGKKVKLDEFDKELQLVKSSYNGSTELNNYLKYLRDRANNLLNNTLKRTYSDAEIKKILIEFIDGYKENHTVNIVKEQLSLYGKPFTFVDLF